MKFVPIEGLDSMSEPEMLLTKIKLARKFPEDSSYVLGYRWWPGSYFGYVATENEDQVNPVGFIPANTHHMYPIGAQGFILCCQHNNTIQVEQLYALSKQVAIDLIKQVENQKEGCSMMVETLNYKDTRKNKMWYTLGFKPYHYFLMRAIAWTKQVGST